MRKIKLFDDIVIVKSKDGRKNTYYRNGKQISAEKREMTVNINENFIEVKEDAAAKTETFCAHCGERLYEPKCNCLKKAAV